MYVLSNGVGPHWGHAYSVRFTYGIGPLRKVNNHNIDFVICKGHFGSV